MNWKEEGMKKVPHRPKKMVLYCYCEECWQYYASQKYGSAKKQEVEKEREKAEKVKALIQEEVNKL